LSRLKKRKKLPEQFWLNINLSISRYLKKLFTYIYIRFYLVLIIIHSSCLLLSQGNYLFNQFTPIDFQINPAKLVNNKNGTYLFFRNQWLSFSNNPKFYSMSGHYKLKSNFFVGGCINRNSFGKSLENNVIQASAAYQAKFAEENHFVSLGIGMKYLRTNYLMQNVIVFDDNDPYFPSNSLIKNNIDFSVGTFYNYKIFKFGLSCPSFIGLVSNKNTFPYNNIINAELGCLINKGKNNTNYQDEITQINFRLRYNQASLFQIETVFDYFASSNYALGLGFRYDKRENVGNSILFHLLFKIPTTKTCKNKCLFALGSEFNIFNKLLNNNNKGTFEGFVGFQNEN
jgi:type IX secretion system PorP/SprF family membrane protein